MTDKERELALYCLKASSDYHSEVCEECINYPNCDHTIQDDVTETIIKALEREPCEDSISRSSIKQKLQEHHDFFVDAYGGFNNLPQNDKARVDEITNCIAMVVNESPVNPQPEIIRCGQCKYAEVADKEDTQDGYICQFHRGSIWFSGSYCSWAERRQDG